MALRPTDFKSVADTNFATGARAQSSRHGIVAHCFWPAVSKATRAGPGSMPKHECHAAAVVDKFNVLLEFAGIIWYRIHRIFDGPPERLAKAGAGSVERSFW